MVSHNKEADQTLKTQNFPAGKTFTGIPSNANIYTSISNKNSENEQKKERSWLYCLHTDFGFSKN